MCLHRGEPLTWFFLVVVKHSFDLGRLQNNHVVTATAVLASSAHPPVLADAAAAAVLALAALPPVLAEAAAAAVLAPAALSPVLAEAATAALLAQGAPPPVLALLVYHLVHVPSAQNSNLHASKRTEQEQGSWDLFC